jgi:hypothetical protein
MGVKLNGTHPLLAYGVDVNLLGDNLYEVHLEANADVSKYNTVSSPKFKSKSIHKERKCIAVQICRSDTNKSKFNSGGSLKETEFQ